MVSEGLVAEVSHSSVSSHCTTDTARSGLAIRCAIWRRNLPGMSTSSLSKNWMNGAVAARSPAFRAEDRPPFGLLMILMFRPSEAADKPTKPPPEASLRVLWRKLRG